MKRILLTAVAAAVIAPHVAWAQPSHCPPGHARKGWCEPGVRYDRDDYRVIRDYGRYNLPPLRDGERYVIIDNQVVRVSDRTGDIIAVIGLASILLD
ncbi:RcnB family protein [Pontivivens ytuae]|uniref:RcnB family protein n=1 Tax=Pontivivens ytuae TaxID=2789856 RepID=A0A7S9LV01_9RHOB|nr:RcnB family protein [Pontivivens ytuae]QPH55230.1 RcnB family protein [Pontivivens ytuae]